MRKTAIRNFPLNNGRVKWEYVACFIFCVFSRVANLGFISIFIVLFVSKSTGVMFYNKLCVYSTVVINVLTIISRCECRVEIRRRFSRKRIFP